MAVKGEKVILKILNERGKNYPNRDLISYILDRKLKNMKANSGGNDLLKSVNSMSYPECVDLLLELNEKSIGVSRLTLLSVSDLEKAIVDLKEFVNSLTKQELSYLVNHNRSNEIAKTSRWVNLFENTFNVELLVNPLEPNRNQLVFVDSNGLTEVIRIDAEEKRIIIYNKPLCAEKRADEIVEYIIDSYQSWKNNNADVARKDFCTQIQIKKKIVCESAFEYIYDEKEALNAFGRTDWSEF